MKKQPTQAKRFEDPVVREVRTARGKIWAEHNQEIDAVAAAAREAAQRLGMKPATWVKPSKCAIPKSRSRRKAA